MPDDQNDWPWRVKPEDLYHILIDTRNLEVSLFWQRSNYFLVLNSGIVFAFFSIKDRIYAILFAFMGLLASALWFWVCLGSKYWQTLWEQRLSDFEKDHLPGLDLFSADSDRRDRDVENALKDPKLGPVQRFTYGLARRKPSVSYSMIKLSLLFILAWLAFIVTFFLSG